MSAYKSLLDLVLDVHKDKPLSEVKRHVRVAAAMMGLNADRASKELEQRKEINDGKWILSEGV